MYVMGRYLKKPLLVYNLPEKKNGNSIKGINTSSYSVVWAIYTSHTGQTTLKHTIFECSAVCLSVI